MTKTFCMEITKVSFCTLNLGFNVQSNIVKGTESSFVEQCQIQHGGTGSKCSIDAVEFASRFDVVGFQEMNLQLWNQYETMLKSFGKLRGRAIEVITSSYFGGLWGVGIAYDSNVMGHGKLVSKPGTLFGTGIDKRGIEGVYFEKHALLVVNLHAPHHLNYPKDFVDVMAELFSGIDPDVKYDRIIVMGDFNDHGGVMASKTPMGTSVKSCCHDNNYKSVGDYIIDSVGDRVLYYGFPHGYDRSKHMYSDHDPVVYETYFLN